MIYVDTSLLLAVYAPEARSKEADEVLDSASSIFVSDLTVAEFYVGLSRKVKLKALTVMLRTLDAIHLAVAEGLGVPLATFDDRLAEAARDLGFEVLPEVLRESP